MLEEDRTAICGPRYAHQADRTASRAGTVPLPTFQTMAQTDPLRRRTVEHPRLCPESGAAPGRHPQPQRE